MWIGNRLSLLKRREEYLKLSPAHFSWQLCPVFISRYKCSAASISERNRWVCCRPGHTELCGDGLLGEVTPQPSASIYHLERDAFRGDTTKWRLDNTVTELYEMKCDGKNYLGRYSNSASKLRSCSGSDNHQIMTAICILSLQCYTKLFHFYVPILQSDLLFIRHYISK